MQCCRRRRSTFALTAVILVTGAIAFVMYKDALHFPGPAAVKAPVVDGNNEFDRSGSAPNDSRRSTSTAPKAESGESLHSDPLYQLRVELDAQNLLNEQAMEPAPTFETREQFEQVLSQLPLDESSKYRIHMHYVRRQIAIEQPDVTLVSQCDADHLHEAIGLAQYWDGPVSVAVFIPGNVYKALATLRQIRACHDRVRERVSFHLVYMENESVYEEVAASELPLEGACENFQDPYEELRANNGTAVRPKLQQQKAPAKYDGVPYPNNFLRNVARSGVSSTFMFVIDIDMRPSRGLRLWFLRLADKRPRASLRTAFVVPTFELKAGAPIPRIRQQLIDTYLQGNARPFYEKACWKCQKPTDFDQWLSVTSPISKPTYKVDWKDPWEPFYISWTNLPLYDERFQRYGFNRISQVCETWVSGFNFEVLTGGYLLHEGFKEPESFHTQKSQENDANRSLFRQFKQDLKSKYPSSTRRC
ncbi:UDP-GlcNAc:betaGal beta-1,3-N-acetylglucosaminyltransferase 1 [Capsaspora owczarzaki ATCC 30864]|uniref:Beta-1,4-glucuronyltransferase 1 n=1 Tax=Capsaspora owczarzaki (strain ATCC 30864) TaxID=595528 RepID=A0A0D2WSL4_CAPO3|nr:UDP-GlcNAc:betaGal beta-1,3-N-acetylglucosaminyltransferase 1 [Capsaspora owczarzaki ATCC 30864]KJE94463.1 UDP-GlcNAc:betaGal beta-1,3-N-acetylglucosaminyltransferase 1 [Capsaspora owczarzaki ATCC 30864]|eukprot:XP_004346787.2 UDP-GlcNAc:betaGal beta-1,3-N-acetylglucosaminyltransferase 1 [Capsaspora owczarzaki ATCC 30864]